MLRLREIIEKSEGTQEVHAGWRHAGGGVFYQQSYVVATFKCTMQTDDLALKAGSGISGGVRPLLRAPART